MVHTNRKRIMIMGILILVLLCVFGTSKVLEYRDYLRTHEAYQDVEFQIGSVNGGRVKLLRLSGDQIEDGDVLRLYLPVISSGENVYIRLNQLGSVVIDGREYRSGDCLGTVQPGIKRYIMFKSPDGLILSRAELKVLSSSHVASMYISLTSHTLENIHDSDKTIRDEAYFSILDAFGSMDAQGCADFFGRGTYSWYETEKKSYNVHLKSPMAFLGMGECSKWALRSTAADTTMMMDQLAYTLARRLELPYAVESEYVNLYIDGEYRGLYLLAQKASTIDGSVRVSDLSASNDWLNKKEVLRYDSRNRMKYYDVSEPSEITGGYLMEFNDHSRYQRNDPGFETEDKYVTIHAPSNIGETETKYIADIVRNAEQKINEADDNTTLADMGHILDLYTWFATYWIDEFLCDYDADFTSFFFYKEKNDPLLYAGPVWDYDEAYWHTFYNDDYQTQMLTTASLQTSSWMQKLENIPSIHEGMKQYFMATFAPAVRSLDQNDVPSIANQLQDAIAMEHDRWNISSEYSTREQEEMYHVWLNARLSFFNDYCVREEEYVTLTFVYPEDSVIRHNVVLAFQRNDLIYGWPGKEYGELWFDEQGNQPYDAMRVDRDYVFYFAN